MTAALSSGMDSPSQTVGLQDQNGSQEQVSWKMGRSKGSVSCGYRTQGAAGPGGEARGEEWHDHSSVRRSKDTVGRIRYEQRLGTK